MDTFSKILHGWDALVFLWIFSVWKWTDYWYCFEIRSSSWAPCILALCRRRLRGWNFEIDSFHAYIIWKWLWNSQNFRCWVFRSSKYPPNGHPNFEAIWRPFVENSPIHLRTHNGRTVDYERSGLSPELHYKPDRELGWYHWKQHARLIFYWENMDHVMCFRT